MKRNRSLHYLLFALLIMSSCASLTKSQLTEVNAFGQLTKNFSSYPGKVIQTLNDVQGQQQLYQVNSQAKPDDHLESVTAVYEYIKNSAKMDSATDLAFRIVNGYGQNLVLLTSDSYGLQLDTAAQKFGTNLDSLAGQYNKLVPNHAIATGYGALVGELVAFAGNTYIKSQQAKAVRSFVTKADTLIGSMTITLEEFLAGKDGHSGKLKADIEKERKHIHDNFLIFLRSDKEAMILKKKNDTTYTGTLAAWHASGFEADRLYIQLLQNLDATEELRQQCLTAVKNLRKAHHKLFVDLQQRKNLKEIYTELQDYGAAVGQMNATIKKIK